MATRNWTEEEKQYIITRYVHDGWTAKQIGKEFHAKYATIIKYLKLWNIEIKNNRTTNRNLNDNYFSSINTEEKAYFLGLLLADGFVSLRSENRAPTIGLVLQQSDLNLILKFKNVLNSDSKITFDARSAGSYGILVRSKQLAEDLSKYNIIPRKTYVVDQLILPPENYIIPFLRGYIDGDGSIYYSLNTWHVNITGHSKELIQQIQNVLDIYINKNNHNKITYANNVYKATWNGQYAIALLKLLYENSNIHLERKYDKAMLAIHS